MFIDWAIKRIQEWLDSRSEHLSNKEIESLYKLHTEEVEITWRQVGAESMRDAVEEGRRKRIF